MTRQRVAIALIAVLLLSAVAYVVVERLSHDHGDAIYFCPMHPTITSDRPKNCPICGMKLVKKTTATGGDAAQKIAESSRIGSSSAAAMNIRTERVGEAAAGSVPATATGRVVVDERRVAAVTSYTAGRVEQLYANFVGDTVRKGSAVATIYSPELFSAQQEYLVAIRNRDRMRASGYAQARSAADDLAASSATKLRLLGLTTADLRRIERGGRPVQNVTISAPVSGVVTQKLVVPQQYVTAGQPLLQVADLSIVWVEADVFEQAIGTIREGSRAVVTFPALPGIDVAGVVSFIQPSLDAATRSVRVRIELPNPRMQLKPEMYANVRFATAAATPRISVASGAIIDRGAEQFVWVETAPGRYDPRRVVVGARAGTRTEIVSGLTPGEVVVTDGAFLLDSEAQLQSAATSTHAHGSAP